MDFNTSASSQAKLEDLRARIQHRLRERRAASKTVPPNPPPRSDEVFARGQQWLDELAAGADLHEVPEP